MASLTKVQRRFEIPFTIVEGGSGIIHGVVTEPDQKSPPAYSFNTPRLVLRTPIKTALRTSMVLQAPALGHFIVGSNGPSEQAEGTLWQSWRLFQATDRVVWSRRSKVIDPITRLPRDSGVEIIDTIWAALEPLDRELGDFRMSTSFEQSRVITGQPIKHDDLVNGRKVTRAEFTLGVTIGTLT